MPTENIDLPSLIEQFGSEDRCRDFLEELRWPDGVECPRCKSKAISRIKARHQFDCDGCRYQFSVRAGTIFHDSKLPLWKWFLAVFLMCESRKGISANQLKRMLKVSYKTAWFLCHRVRAAMHDETERPLSGIVEMDETFLGGKAKNGGSAKGKIVVLGAASRGGEVRLQAAKSRKSRAIQGFIEKHVSKDAEALYTDAYPAYRFEAKAHGVPHDSVNRTEGGWVNGQVHTNTIEGVWSLLDRSIIGAYHKISAKHLPRYLDELEWRFNNRKNAFLFRDTMLELIDAKQLEYKELVA